MPRVKRGVTARARHKKVLASPRVSAAAASNVFRIAKEAVMKAGQYAYRDRRTKKRVFRQLWIARINAAARANGLTYSQFAKAGSARRASTSTARSWPISPTNDPAAFSRHREPGEGQAGCLSSRWPPPAQGAAAGATHETGLGLRGASPVFFPMTQ